MLKYCRFSAQRAELNLPDVTSAMVQTSAGDIEVAAYGPTSGDAIVLVSHGVGSWSSLHQIALRLARTDPNMRIIAWSRPGCGLSPCYREPDLSEPLLCEATVVLPALLDALHIAAASFLAHADGATVALIFAGLFPERTIGVAALAPYGFADAQILAAVMALPSSERESELSEQLNAYHPEPEAVYERWRRRRISECSRGWSAIGHFTRISAPLLIVQGIEDAFISLGQMTAIAAGVTGPVDWVMLKNTGHFLAREASEQLVAVVLRHLMNASGRSAPKDLSVKCETTVRRRRKSPETATIHTVVAGEART